MGLVFQLNAAFVFYGLYVKTRVKKLQNFTQKTVITTVSVKYLIGYWSALSWEELYIWETLGSGFLHSYTDDIMIIVKCSVTLQRISWRIIAPDWILEWTWITLKLVTFRKSGRRRRNCDFSVYKRESEECKYLVWMCIWKQEKYWESVVWMWHDWMFSEIGTILLEWITTFLGLFRV